VVAPAEAEAEAEEEARPATAAPAPRKERTRAPAPGGTSYLDDIEAMESELSAGWEEEADEPGEKPEEAS
jgi:hypothetical protein